MEIDRWIGAMLAVMQTLKWSVVVQNTKLSICRSIYVPTLTYGLWEVTKQMRSSTQVAEICFLCRIVWLSLGNRVRMDIWGRFRLELQLLHIERSHLKWFGHLVRCLLDISLGKCFGQAHPGR